MANVEGNSDDAAVSAVKGTNTSTPAAGSAVARSVGVEGQSDDGFGVFGHSVNNTGVVARSKNGFALEATAEKGCAVLAIGPQFGVLGSSADDPVTGLNTGTGVEGVGAGGPGVVGRSTSGPGIQGFSQSGFGVTGESAFGPGVFGNSPKNFPGVQGASVENHGVHGSSVSGRGVVGISDSFFGVSGQSKSSIAVIGESEQSIGVFGKSSANSPGVQGVSVGGHGVEGESNSKEGVFGFSDSGSGVSGTSNSGVGVLGKGARNAGVFGFHGDPHFQEIPTLPSEHAGVFGASEEGAGVMGYSRNTASFGVIAFGGIQASALNRPLAGSFEGDVHVHGNVDITGDLFLPGADCAEQFDSVGLAEIAPGSVVVIDQEGALRQSHIAYDRKVAGVASGAGKCKPGIVLDKQTGENRVPVALVGKVYCKVDAQYGPIEVGDMLTSSPTAGHAMKADDPVRAFGAVIGKALRPCTSGCNLIPVLVSLQ